SNTIQFSSTLSIRNALILGTTASFSDRHFSGVTRDAQTLTRINAFTTIGKRIGSIRIDLLLDDLDSRIPENERKRNAVAGSFSWRMPERIDVTTELRFEREQNTRRGTTHRTELSTLFRYSVLDNVSVSLNAGLFDTRGRQYSQGSGLSLTADARWRFLPRWEGSASISRNRAKIDWDFDPYASLDSDMGTSMIWLTVRHWQSAGRPLNALGHREQGQVGSGVISGQVFFDENRDTVRQPHEQAAVGVVVLLDGRYEARTDALGYYSFEPVPTGTHDVVVLTEQLPLPWGLEDESPRQIEVGFRQNATVDFPLRDFN
ncbi:MAG: hypothetical protein ACWGPN_10715, partial [Gammaproteobacteria bacterium]